MPKGYEHTIFRYAFTWHKYKHLHVLKTTHMFLVVILSICHVTYVHVITHEYVCIKKEKSCYLKWFYDEFGLNSQKKFRSFIWGNSNIIKHTHAHTHTHNHFNHLWDFKTTTLFSLNKLLNEWLLDYVSLRSYGLWSLECMSMDEC